jgi:paraquat-inducible protein B
MSSALNITIHVETVHLHVDGIDTSTIAVDRSKRTRKKSNSEHDARLIEGAAAFASSREHAHVDADLNSSTSSASSPAALIQPDSPRLAEMRDTLRRIGKSDALEALAFITEIVGRKVDRLGQLTEDEVTRIQAELNTLKSQLGG